MKIFYTVFLAIIVWTSTVACGQTLRIFNDFDQPVVASVVSGDAISNQQLPAMTWFDFNLKDDADDRVLILRTLSSTCAESGTETPPKVITTKIVNLTKVPSKLIVALLRGETEEDLTMFCIGRGDLLPIGEEPVSENQRLQLKTAFFDAADRLKEVKSDNRI